jgi:hypothetical protein
MVQDLERAAQLKSKRANKERIFNDAEFGPFHNTFNPESTIFKQPAFILEQDPV